VLSGLLAGGLSVLLTGAVYAAEDAFQHLPIHWMWWPAIGGLVIGIGGLIFPQALGVGYDTISALLQGDVPAKVIIGVLIVKSIIWSFSLGSGTSGGVLAPLLMMGGALGGVEAWFLPDAGAGFWPLVSMGAILGGTMRSPLTGVMFALELTHDVNMLLPLLVAVSIAHGFTVLVLRRSILTEKVARRGYHLSREYTVDPLEILFVREVMRTSLVALAADAAPSTQGHAVRAALSKGRQRLYPIVDEERRLRGVATRADLQPIADGSPDTASAQLLAIVRRSPVTAYPDEPLRIVVNRMAETGMTRLPVIERGSRKLVGIVGLTDLLKARSISLDAERRRERVLKIRMAAPAVRSHSAS
jgi:CBS domain-containing protein